MNTDIRYKFSFKHNSDAILLPSMVNSKNEIFSVTLFKETKVSLLLVWDATRWLLIHRDEILAISNCWDHENLGSKDVDTDQ